MDLTDAFMTLRHYTDAGTSAREAVDWLDDYIYNEAGKLDALPALVDAVKVEERSTRPDISRVLHVGQNCLVYVMSPRFVKDCAGDDSNITMVGPPHGPGCAKCPPR
jgi:hypothetical protein